MQSVGLKISQPFYDARTAGDVNLLFSSSWPSISIVKDITFTATTTFGGGVYSYDSQTITHDLGYQFSLCWETNGGVATRNADHLAISKGEVVWSNPTTSASPLPSLSVNVKVYNIDITKAVNYPFVKPPSYTLPYNRDFGIKVVKPNRSIKSDDMRDYVLHSRCPSPALLSVVTGTTTASYTNTEGYVAWIFGYASHASGPYRWAGIGAQSSPRLFVNKPTQGVFEIDGLANDAVSLIVLRDPLVAATNINATY